MRHLWLLSLLLLASCYYPYGPYYGYGGYPYPNYPYGYAPTYYAPGSPPPFYGNQQVAPYEQRYYENAQPGYGGPAASDPNNCGTPYEPKPCYGRPR